jgi:hypothetical protein
MVLREVSSNEIKFKQDANNSVEPTKDKTNTFIRYLPLLFTLIFFAIYLFICYNLGESIDWDTQNYHFFDPYWLLVNHFHDIQPAQLQTYYNPLLDIPYYYGVLFLSPRVLTLLLGAVQASSFVPLYLISRSFKINVNLSAIIAALGLLGAANITELGTVMGDNIVDVLGFWALYLILKELNRNHLKETYFWKLFLIGIFLGAAVGLKLTFGTYLFGVLLAFIFLPSLGQARFLKLLQLIMGFIIGFYATYGPWSVILFAKYSNPILPYLNQIFHSPYAPFAANTDTRFIPKGPIGILFDPFIFSFHPLKSLELAFRQLSIPIAETLLFTALISKFYKLFMKRYDPMFSLPERFFIIWAVSSYFLWATISGNYRYFVPLEAVTFILIYILLRAIFSNFKMANIITVASLCLIAIVSLTTEEPANYGRSSFNYSIFKVEIPGELKAPYTGFLMAGYNPYSFVIPYFSASDRFDRIQSNIGVSKKDLQIILQSLHNYSNVYLIWSESGSSSQISQTVKSVSSVLTYLNYDVQTSECKSFPVYTGNVSQYIFYCPLNPAI